MAAKHSLHVALTEPLARYVTERVASGQYATASEVVRTGLRLLIERDLAKDHVGSRGATHGPQAPAQSRRGSR